VTFPAAIDDDGQTVKNLYGAGGGANHFVLVDRSGVVAEMVRNQHGGLNEVEVAIRRTLANDGLKATDASIEEHHDRTQVPGLEPVRHRIRLQPGAVEAVDAARDTLTVAVVTDGGKLTYPVGFAPASRLVRQGRPVKLSEVKAGSPVLVEGFLDAMLDQANPKPNYQKLDRQTVSAGGRELTLEPLGGYGVLRRVWYVMADSKPSGFTARSVEVLPQAGNPPARWPDAITIWACGKVTAHDGAAGTLTFERPATAATDYKGYRFWLAAKDAGQKLYLDDTAAQRLHVVAGWVKADSRFMTIRTDDAADVILNGRFGATWDDVRVGDFVGVEFDTGQPGQSVILPRTVRVSR